MSPEESKFTLKIGVIASFIAALVVFILSTLWGHNTAISRLDTNQAAVMKTLEKMDTIPEKLASIDMQLIYISKAQGLHSQISVDNNKLLKNGAKK
jgi:hypothetical protein